MQKSPGYFCFDFLYFCDDEGATETSFEMVFALNPAAVSLQHTYFCARRCVDTPRGFYRLECNHLHNEPLQLFSVDMHPLVKHQEKKSFFIYWGMFAPTEEYFKNEKKYAVYINGEVDKWALNITCILINCIFKYIFSNLHIISLQQLCKTVKFSSVIDSRQSCSDSALSVCRRILPGDTSCRTQWMIHRVSDCLESAQRRSKLFCCCWY